MNKKFQSLFSTLNLEIYTIRLPKGEDLKEYLTDFVTHVRVEAGFVMTCVGSLTKVSIRLANQEPVSTFEGYYEIVSLGGTLSMQGSHLHVSVADSKGVTIGGHLMEGCLVYTTVEVVLGILPNVLYRRELDPISGYKELNVYRKPKK